THDDSAIEPGRPQQAQLVAFIAELEQRVLRPQEKSRMWCERQRRRLAAKRPAAHQGRANDGPTTPMNAIEVADTPPPTSHPAAPAGGRLSAPCAPARATWNCFVGRGPLIARPSDYVVIRSTWMPSIKWFQASLRLARR